MSKWIGIFLKLETNEDHETLTSELRPSLNFLSVAVVQGVAVKLICAETDSTQLSALQEWLARNGVKGVVATNQVDTNCTMIIGTDVFRLDRTRDWFCPHCKDELKACSNGHGISGWPPQGGGFIEYY